jgi:GntR family transcriptional regulator
MLPFSVTFRPGVPIHDQVVYAVTRGIVAGQLRPGDPFPSVRTLSQELGINPNTAHKIVATLISEGLLTVRAGVGTVIGDPPPDRGTRRRDALDEGVERLVVVAKRSGLSLRDLMAAVRRHWKGVRTADGGPRTRE